MKKIALLTALMIMIGMGVQAQFPGGNSKQAPNIGHIYGKITDSTDVAINGASVLLLQNRFDQLVKKEKMCC